MLVRIDKTVHNKMINAVKTDIQKYYIYT